MKGTAMYRVSQKLKNIKKELKKWNREVFKNVQKRKDQIKEELESLEQEMIRGVEVRNRIKERRN